MILIAYNIRSLHNVGSIFRSADAFGVERLYLTGITGQPPRREIAKVSLGSEDRVAWEHRDDVLSLIVELKSQGITVLALEMSPDSLAISVTERRNKIALIVGNEVEGLDKTVLAAVDEIVEIPLTGGKKSLNVSVATGIALFAFTRK